MSFPSPKYWTQWLARIKPSIDDAGRTHSGKQSERERVLYTVDMIFLSTGILRVPPGVMQSKRKISPGGVCSEPSPQLSWVGTTRNLTGRPKVWVT